MTAPRFRDALMRSCDEEIALPEPVEMTLDTGEF